MLKFKISSWPIGITFIYINLHYNHHKTNMKSRGIVTVITYIFLKYTDETKIKCSFISSKCWIVSKSNRNREKVRDKNQNDRIKEGLMQ